MNLQMEKKKKKNLMIVGKFDFNGGSSVRELREREAEEEEHIMAWPICAAGLEFSKAFLSSNFSQ